jgi:hypothetical protein
LFKQALKLEGDQLTHTLEQPTRGLILDTAEKLRQIGGIADRPGLGRWALSVPFEDWLRLRAKYPDLAATDQRVKSRAWLKFISSPEAAPFKVRERV